MIRHWLALHLTQAASLRSGGMRAIASAAWPAWTGLLAFMLGLLMLAGAAYLHNQTGTVLDSPIEPASRVRSPAASRSGTGGTALQLPPYETHLDDIELLFEIARAQAVNIGPIEYRWETNPSMPVQVRLVDLRMTEDYSKLKAFLAELLERLPHAYLREIRVEQGSVASSAKVHASLGLSFVYEAPTATTVPAASTGSTERSSETRANGTAIPVKR